MPSPLFVVSRAALSWPGHVFPSDKYERLLKRLAGELGLPDACFETAQPASEAQILLVHSADYLARVKNYRDCDPEAAVLEFEAPCDASVYGAFLLMAGASIRASEIALAGGLAMNVGGGFHHAFADRGEGFCIFNDIAVSIRETQRRGLAARIAVIDCDLHQGNGTARIFQGDESVFTFSIHQEHNYPVKERSDWDIGLENGTGDDEYCALLDEAVAKILADFHPDLVHYAAGADPFEKDMLGNLELSKAGLARRDKIVLERSRRAGTPVVCTLAGGYAQDTEDVVDIHFNLAARLARMAGAIA
jgi:acetoin utilization deacetylase AcuC-like enzyme